MTDTRDIEDIRTLVVEIVRWAWGSGDGIEHNRLAASAALARLTAPRDAPAAEPSDDVLVPLTESERDALVDKMRTAIFTGDCDERSLRCADTAEAFFRERAVQPAAPAQPTAASFEATKDTCAHFDESKGRCLLLTRNWASGRPPSRCVGCPDAAPAQPTRSEPPISPDGLPTATQLTAAGWRHVQTDYTDHWEPPAQSTASFEARVEAMRLAYNTNIGEWQDRLRAMLRAADAIGSPSHVPADLIERAREIMSRPITSDTLWNIRVADCHALVRAIAALPSPAPRDKS